MSFPIYYIIATKGASGTGDGAGLNFYTGEVSSLKIQPKTVLVISLVYLGIVVLLHIWSKIRSGGIPTSTDVPP